MKTAFIIASGRGVRMQSITDKPKALIEIAGRVLLEHTIKRFINIGIENIYIVIRYNKLSFIKFLNELDALININIKLLCLEEDSYQDSAINDFIRSIKAYNISVPNDILISFCDTITDFDISALIDEHYSKMSMATLLLFKGNSELYQSKYLVDKNNKIISITNDGRENSNGFVQGGIFILGKGLIDNYNLNQKIYFSTDDGPIERAYLKESLFGLKVNCNFFMEIGNPDNYFICERRLMESQSLFNKIFIVKKTYC